MLGRTPAEGNRGRCQAPRITQRINASSAICHGSDLPRRPGSATFMESHERPNSQATTLDVLDKNDRLEISLNQHAVSGRVHEQSGRRVLTAVGLVELDRAHRIAQHQFVMHCGEGQWSRVSF